MNGRSLDSEATQSLTSPPEALGAARASMALGTPAVRTTGGPRAIRPAQPRDRERYALLGEHGRGALGRVTRAHDVELGRDVERGNHHMKKSTNREAQRRKVVLQRETIVSLTPPELGEVHGGQTFTVFTKLPPGSQDNCA